MNPATRIASRWLLAALIAPTSVVAQSTNPVALPEVVVTATKQVQTLEKVPASLVSLDSEFIHERAATNFKELTDYTPNVTINLSGSSGQFVIRGLGTPDTNQGFDPSVGTVVDGVYYGRANFLAAFFNDLERFEVLRGPQGTLFGKNSTAGLILVTSTPPIDELKFDGEVLARSYGDLSIRPALSIPITKDLALRFSGNFQNGDRNTLYNTRLQRPEENEAQATLRARARYASDAGVVLDINVLQSRQTQNNSNFQFLQLSQPMEAAIRRYDPLYDSNLDHRTVSTNFPSAENATVRSFSSTLELPLPDFGGINNFRVTSISALAQSKTLNRDIDADFTAIPFISDRLAEPALYKQLSQEIRFSGSGKDLFGYGHGVTFIAGVYLLRSSYISSDLFSLEDLGGAAAYCTAANPGMGNCNENLPGGAGTVGSLLAGPVSALLPYLGATGINDQNVRTRLAQKERTYAGFGQFEYNFLSQWALIGGVRYGSERKEGQLSALASSELVRAIAGSENYTSFIARDESDYSPKAGLRWSPNKHVSSYFTFARGYKSGGFNGLPLRSTQNDYGPERATSYEIGAKARLLNGRLRVGAAVFRTDFDNLQVSTFQNNRFIVLNAAAARSQGFETDAQWLPTFAPFLLLRGSLGYADARYLSYKNGPCYSDQPSNTPGATPLEPSTPCMQNLTGNRLPYAPKLSAAVSPNLFFPLGNGLNGTLGLDWIYSSSRFLDVDDDPRKLQGDTSTYNAFLIVQDASKQWQLNFAVRNISDVRYYAQILGQPLAPGNFAASGINEPRLFTQSIRFSF